MDFTSGKSSSSATVSQVLGDITWLITQSPNHQGKTVADLAWLLMMPILKKQFHLFYEGKKPVGAAIWATTDCPTDEAIIAGEFDPAHCAEAAWCSGPNLWLIELIAPFSTPENHQAEMMFGDLMTGPFKGRRFKTKIFNPVRDAYEVATFEADSGIRLVQHIAGGLMTYAS